jgi:nitrogen fixation/metabolism regulation signal transduction histidine kinase
MFKKLILQPSLNMRLILIMMFLSFFLITILMIMYAQSEEKLIKQMELQTSDLTRAIQIGVEEVTTSKGTTDQQRLAQYLNKLNAKGVKEISIINNTDQIVASSDVGRVGEAVSHKRKELIIKAELGDPVSEEGRTYNVILPVVAGDTLYGYIHLKINKDDFSDILRANAIKRIIATMFVFGIGMIFTLILSRHYTRPIQKVVDASIRVAAGDLNQQIRVQSNDEIGKLSESFNFMISKLREARSLEDKLHEAAHLSGLGQLSRHMAHEIRNPLNFISLSIDHIGAKYMPPDADGKNKFGSLIGGIRQEIQRLDKIVNEFLEYSKPMALNRRMVKVEDLLHDIFDLVWAKAEVARVKIIMEPFEAPDMYLDADLFKTCILNAVTNAFHALASKEEGGILNFKTTITDTELVLSISDNGEGVRSENIGKIFEPFFTTKEHGLGLGLPMTKRVIEEHGGNVEFNSTQGVGTEIKFILPLSKVQ